MAEPQVFRLRATFCKQGRLALLSHLEVARALERAVRRAGLPFAVSQGFSPHMKIAFGAALPVGVGGTHEIFDLQLTRYVAPDQVLAALQAASTPDLMVKACRYIEPRAAAASVAYPFSTYRAQLTYAPAQLPVPQTISVVRKRKERQLEVAEFVCGEMKLEGSVLTFTLEAKPTGSLRPDLLLQACCAEANASEGEGEGAPLALLLENAMPSALGLEPRPVAGGSAPAGAGQPAPLDVVTLTRIAQRDADGQAERCGMLDD